MNFPQNHPLLNMNIEDNIYSRFYHLNSLRYAICATTISSNIELWYCIAVFPRLYPNTTFMPNTDYTDYTDNWVVFIIWTDNVTLSVQRRYLLKYNYDIVLLYSRGCIKTLPTYQKLITLIMESFLSSGQIKLTACWLPSTRIHRIQLAVGTSSRSAHTLTESN